MSKIVERTLDFLELFAEHKRPLILSDISRLLKIPVSSCHDVLRSLQDRGYIYELSPRGGYYPTMRLQALGKSISDNDPIILGSQSILRELRDALDESVLLAKVDGMRATYLLSFEPSHPLRFLLRAGDEVRALYATSGGKALLAHLKPQALAAYLQSTKLIPHTPNTITNVKALRAELAESLSRKWFLNKEETLDGVTTISSTFFWSGTLYIVTVAAPTSRLETRLVWVASQIIDACERLGTRCGGQYKSKV